VPGTGGVYRIYADTVTAGESKGVQGTGCVNQSVFFPGDVIVWRAMIADAATGVELTRDQITQLGLTVTATLADGTKVRLLFGPHPAPFIPAPLRETYWSGPFLIKADHPTGTMTWTLTATDTQGHSATFTPLGQASGAAILTIAAKGPAAAK